MSLQLGNYSPETNNLTVGGVIIDGYAPDTFIKASRNQDTWTYKASNSGGGARSRNPDKSGTIEITLHNGSPSNAYLSSLCRTDELLGTGVVETQVVDRSTAQASVMAAKSWIKKTGDFERGTEVGTTTWIIETDDLDIIHDGLVPV